VAFYLYLPFLGLAVLANEGTPDPDVSLARACEYILSLTPEERLRKAGVLSGNFWLRNVF
jgi:hypothetical protein